MPYDLDERLVVGVSSSALFNLAESDEFFQAHGEIAYREYQDKHLGDILQPGVAFPFITRLLQLNDLRPEDPLVEVIVLSRNDPNTGLRVMRSIEHHDLPITRSVFTQGRAPYAYIEALSMSLFLSGNRPDVEAAIRAGFPAGHVLPSAAKYDDTDQSLVIAFDFDGVLASDEAERVFRSSGNILNYFEHESTHKDDPLTPGPLKHLLADLNRVQQIEENRRASDPTYVQRLRIALVTARNAPAHERAVHSLRDWGVNVNDAFSLGGIEKARILKVMKPHIFFDDQTAHLDGTTEFIAGVHVPYGIANELAERNESGEARHVATGETVASEQEDV
ncbi:5'-nucleotidase [Pseudonocardia tropica]|uniref:5'-nucleotidase n=1 Tax=Pseudonocardia tropica TaxID=681289 RepID=A0ABV1JZH6_9PSEU